MTRILSALAVIGALTACGGAAPPGMISFGEILLDGEVDGQAFVGQMRQLDPRLEACFSRAKRQDHSVQGVMRLHLRGGGGRLIPEVQMNETGSEALADCVTGAITGLTLVEPVEAPPWDFEADWELTFILVGQDE